jgi:hypothetical protein
MWRTRSIFVSSTFQDMQAERDYLRNFVFQNLRSASRPGNGTQNGSIYARDRQSAGKSFRLSRLLR